MIEAITAETLKNTALGLEMDMQECAIVAGVCAQRTVPSGEVLFNEGDSDNELFIIIEGRLAVSRSTSGYTNVLHILNPGDLAGESGFLDGKPHSATLRAMGETTVLCLHRERLESLMNEHPHLVYAVMRAIIRSIRETIRRMNSQCQQMSNYISQFGGRY
ncbi:MAG: cyclic nucleotide-binding domain-containing protein [Halothiobacillaceae bacterium]|jgi:CRP-like cAMP-binding protein|nr:cyclic nucleotide-binding domain-containing protein [Halothiobacillaceae bacterium]MDY0049962.1 cyclic nucleotide-binding domain-containing protein [Halothiobacillaceae bacterium]